MSSWAKKSALITGGAGGIGRALAALLLERGATVTLADTDRPGLEAAARALGAGTERLLAIEADVTDEPSIAGAVARCTTTFGRLDLAFNAAGIAPASASELLPVAELGEAVWDRTIAVHLLGAWLSMKHELLAMERTGAGVVVNIASRLALKGGAGLSAYSAAKHGVLSLAMGAAAAYGGTGIRVHTVCPGKVASPIGQRLHAFERRRWTAAPERQHTEEQVASAALWLCADELAGTTGQCLTVG